MEKRPVSIVRTSEVLIMDKINDIVKGNINNVLQALFPGSMFHDEGSKEPCIDVAPKFNNYYN